MLLRVIGGTLVLLWSIRHFSRKILVVVLQAHHHLLVHGVVSLEIGGIPHQRRVVFGLGDAMLLKQRLLSHTLHRIGGESLRIHIDDGFKAIQVVEEIG